MWILKLSVSSCRCIGGWERSLSVNFKALNATEGYCLISFLKPATNLSIIKDFVKNGHVTYHVTYGHNINLYFQMFKTMSSSYAPNLDT